MNTPIYDFAKKYSESEKTRLHMPGHKGKSLIGIEHLDITEISGADSLYEADGIIKESEENASSLFGCRTFYSTEGSSQCIRAMLYLTTLYAKNKGMKPLVLAGRNAHKTFLSAAVLLDFDIEWIYPDESESYLSCNLNTYKLEKIIDSMCQKPVAVYITNPDYLGNCIDLKPIASVCRKNDILLIVDNAHGAYLKFLPESLHPIDMGADLCCDSAHKTLPALTGGAYLHISDSAPVMFTERAKNALAMFGSTSPSYIILQSLDLVNEYIYDGYPDNLKAFVSKLTNFKNDLVNHGYSFIGNEPLKLSFDIKKYGYTGLEFADILADMNVICEFADRDFVVLMFTPDIDEDNLEKLKRKLVSVPEKEPINACAPSFSKAEKVFSVREASFAECETIPVSESIGRVLAVSDVGCPPAVPVLISGERIDEKAVNCFEYYGIKQCTVIK